MGCEIILPREGYGKNPGPLRRPRWYVNGFPVVILGVASGRYGKGRLSGSNVERREWIDIRSRPIPKRLFFETDTDEVRTYKRSLLDLFGSVSPKMLF